jgi:hypothetical protein
MSIGGGRKTGTGTTENWSEFITWNGGDYNITPRTKFFAEGSVQIGGIESAARQASAIAEVISTTKGFLLPRMTGAQMTAISSPATSLLIYNTDSTGFCYYNGSSWVKIGASTGGGGGGGVAQSVITDTLLNYWRMTGNHVTGGVEKFLGSVNNRSLRFRSNNIERLLLDSASGGLFIKSDANSVNDIRFRLSGGQTGSPANTATFYNDGSIDFRTWNNAVFLATNVAGTSMQVGHSSMDMQLSAGQIYMGANVSMQGGSTLRGSDYSNNKIQLNQNYMRLVAHGQNGVATQWF